MCCVNAGFESRHPDTFTPKLRGYEQKRYRGRGISEVSRLETYETVPDRTRGRWRACAVKVHVLIWGDLQAYP